MFKKHKKSHSKRDIITKLTAPSHKEIFVSHCFDDTEIMKKLTSILDGLFHSSVTVFNSSSEKSGVTAGEKISRGLIKNLSESELMIAIITDSYVRSLKCISEISSFWYSEKPVIPIIFNGKTGEKFIKDLFGFEVASIVVGQDSSSQCSEKLVKVSVCCAFTMLRQTITLAVKNDDTLWSWMSITLPPERTIDGTPSMELFGKVGEDSLARIIYKHEFEIFFDDPDIKRFITNFISMISNAWGESFEKNQKFKELALSIYYQFTAPTTEHYKKYLVLSKYLWTVNCLELSIEIQNKIKQLFVNNEGKHIYTSDEAETLMQIGLTYQQKADYRNAYLELENAAKIFANRYAASLSHLAQAYMKAKNKPFDQIEPLYKQSLEIRQQFWADTISEASSCHLYAKALSEYQVNLTLAIELEKRAYKLFSSLQPGHINVSSAAYILGWLYVQTAEDLDDIEFGIQKLLEAKNIRLKGREKLHPWFEDIYLKLGLAYQKSGQMNEAKDYFELLLQVREKKYSDVTDEKPITESYKLLQTVYEALDDTEGIRKCKKYLKYHL